MGESLASLFAKGLTQEQKRERLAGLTDREAEALAYDWKFWARPEQLTPAGDWKTWLILAGRGWGKTRTGAEQVIAWAQEHPGIRIALVGQTPADVRDVMVEGESGILESSPPWFKPLWVPSQRRLTWPNGSRATSYSGFHPQQLRGPQHHKAWADELAAWKYPKKAWDNLMFGLRLGNSPQCVVTTTPTPILLLRTLMKRARTVLTKGTTYDNAANLAADFLTELLEEYEGTTLGRQELHAELLDETPGALWARKNIDRYRVPKFPPGLEIVNFRVGVDPAASSKKTSDETGIVVAAKADNGHGYVFHDLSDRLSPNGWGTRVVDAYHGNGLDRVIGEVNNGGDMVEEIIRGIDPNVSYRGVHASKGKYARAEPVAALYEQGKIHHVGLHEELEDQQCTWLAETGESPDRIDALVWVLWSMMLEHKAPRMRSLAPDVEAA